MPTLAERQAVPVWAQPALNLFPAPNGADLGNGLAQWNGRNIRPSSLHSGLVRMDQAITSRGTFFGRYNDSPSANEFGSTQVNRLDLRFQSLTMGLNVRPAAHAALDFRVNESQASAQSTWSQAGASSPAGCALQSLTSSFFGGPIPCDSLVRFAISGVGQVVSGSEGRPPPAPVPASAIRLPRTKAGMRCGSASITAALCRFAATQREP